MKPYEPTPEQADIKQASNAALYSLLNLTILPGLGFILLLLAYRKADKQSISHYHAGLGIRINLAAASVLFIVSALMIFLGGFDSPWTWVYVISYFTIVHTIFIVFAIWALVRAWSGDKLLKLKPNDAKVNTQSKQDQTGILPGDFAIWIFIFAELLVFGIFFIIYAVVRAQNVALFNQYQDTLNREIGAINTVLLITASYFVVLAIQAIRRDETGLCSRWLSAAIGTGGGFLILKSIEFYGKFSAGIGLDTNTFYFFYISLAFFHFLHVILGMIILLAILIKLRRGKYSAAEHTGIETGASYWHMVDLVWIILFPLVYIIR